MPQRKRYLTNAEKQQAYRRREILRARGIPESPRLHQGSFQDYQSVYTGKVDVLITDPPYGREFLTLYKDLTTFAMDVLVPGGWLLCLTGWGLIHEILTLFNDVDMEYITVCTYLMPGATGHGEKRTTTGLRTWNQQAKPLLWYQKPGTKLHRRRAGTSDLIQAKLPTRAKDWDREDFHWQQSLKAFEQIVWLFTNPQDVVCDPCMGSGTTLIAALAVGRQRLIGMEKDPETYALACARLASVQGDS